MKPNAVDRQLSQAIKLLIVLLILSIAAVPTLPNYVTHNWAWNHPLKAPRLTQLRSLQQTGLTLPGWQTLSQQVIEIGGKKWSIQTLQPSSSIELKQAYLLLKPQTWERDQPEVEWMDIIGTQHWTTDSQESLSLTVKPAEQTDTTSPIAIKARFLRGWSQQQTYAILQWYAWSNGGSPASSRWFWADQLTQLQHHQRLPWVAVCLLIPIQPFGEIEQLRSIASSLAQAIQSALLESALHPAA